jgi:hypothetical protein
MLRPASFEEPRFGIVLLVRLALLLAVSSVTMLSAERTWAQDMVSEETTFADANGLMWAVGVTELALGAGVVSLVGADCHGSSCQAGALATLLGALSIGIGVGTAAGEAGVGPEAPFLFHHFLSSAVVGFLPTVVLLDQDNPDEIGFMGAMAMGTVTGLAMSAYPFVRRHTLLHDPDAAVGAHLLAWLPLGAGLAATLALAAVDADDEEIIIVSFAMLAAYGLAIGVVEASVSGSDTAVAPPTIGLLTRTADVPVTASIGFSF